MSRKGCCPLSRSRRTTRANRNAHLAPIDSIHHHLSSLSPLRAFRKSESSLLSIADLQTTTHTAAPRAISTDLAQRFESLDCTRRPSRAGNAGTNESSGQLTRKPGRESHRSKIRPSSKRVFDLYIKLLTLAARRGGGWSEHNGQARCDAMACCDRCETASSQAAGAREPVPSLCPSVSVVSCSSL